MGKRSKNKKITLIFKLAVAAALIGYFLITNDITEIWNNFQLVSPGVWGIAFLFLIIEAFINAKKWQQLLKGYSFIKLVQINIITGFYSLVLPGQLASEALKAYILGKEEKDLERVSASVLVDKLTGLVALLVLGTIGVLLTEQELDWYMAFIFIGGSVLMVMALFLINLNIVESLLKQIICSISKRIPKLEKAMISAVKLIDSWKEFSDQKSAIFTSVFLGVLFQFFSSWMGMIFTQAVGLNIGLIDWFWIQAILSLALLLPITIGGIGVREGTLIGVLGALGASPELALVVSFGFFGQQIMRAVAGGILELLRTAKTKEKETI